MDALKTYEIKELTISADPGKILHVVMHGDFTPKALQFFEEKGKKLIGDFYLDKILTDARLTSSQNVEENRGKLAELTNTKRFKKIAMVVSSAFQKVVSSFIVTAAHNSVRFFTSEEEALTWLRSPQS